MGRVWILFPLILSLLGAGCGKAPQERGNKTILVLGDSLTEGYGLGPDRAYPAVLERLVRDKGFPGVRVTGDGVSGATTENGLERLKARLEPADGSTPPRFDILVLALGANDGLRGLDLPGVKERLSSMVTYAQGRGLKVVLAGMRIPPHRGLDYMGRFEKIYGELAEERGVALIPFLLKGVAAKPSLNMDGVHPNEKGQEKLAETVFKALEPLL